MQTLATRESDWNVGDGQDGPDGGTPERDLGERRETRVFV